MSLILVPLIIGLTLGLRYLLLALMELLPLLISRPYSTIIELSLFTFKSVKSYIIDSYLNLKGDIFNLPSQSDIFISTL